MVSKIQVRSQRISCFRVNGKNLEETTQHMLTKNISHSLNPEPLNMLSLQKDCTQAAVRVGANITRQLKEVHCFPNGSVNMEDPLYGTGKLLRCVMGPSDRPTGAHCIDQTPFSRKTPPIHPSARSRQGCVKESASSASTAPPRHGTDHTPGNNRLDNGICNNVLHCHLIIED